MVSFQANRQAAIAAIVVVLMLLVGLPSPFNPALAQSAPIISLNPTEGAPGTGVTIQGSGWIPGETVILWFAVNLEADGSSTENTIWYDLGEAVVGDDGTFVSTFTSSSHFPSWLTGPSWRFETGPWTAGITDDQLSDRAERTTLLTLSHQMRNRR